MGAIVSPVNKLLPGGGYTGGAIGAASQPVSTENKTTLDVIQAKWGNHALMKKILIRSSQ